MQDEYDMSKGTRGKFYKKDAIFSRTIPLETELCAYYQKLADSKEVRR